MSVERSELNVERSAPRGAVFLSYASQDAEAARKICETLRAMGVEVWFDQSELRGGDAWDQSIRKQIKACALFVPVISANTQARSEGYFRLEWKLADDRTHLMAKGTRFILPVCVDDTKDWDAVVPDSFTTVQWTRLLAGEGAAAFAERVKKLLSGELGALRQAQGLATRSPSTSSLPGGKEMEAGRSRPAMAGSGDPALQKARRISPPLLLLGGLAILVIGIVAFFILKPRRSPEEVAKILSEAQTIMANATKAAPAGSAEIARVRARLIPDQWQKGDFEAVSPTLDRLIQANPEDADAWALRSIINSMQVTRNIDSGTKPLEEGRAAADRALRLAPESPLAELALGMHLNAMISRGGDPLAGQPHVLRAVAALPRDALTRFAELVSYWQGYNAGGTERVARAWLAAEPGATYPQWILAQFYITQRRPGEAEKWAEGAAADLHITGTRALYTLFESKYYLRADLAAAKVTLARVPAEGRMVHRVIHARWLLAMAEQRWDEALQELARVPGPMLYDRTYHGPRSLLAGLAHQRAGRADAALAQFREAERLLRSELVSDTENEELHLVLAITLACAGRSAEARSELALVEPLLQGRAPSIYWGAQVVSIAQAYGVLGEFGRMAEWLRKLFVEPSGFPFTPASLQLDPRFAGMLRAPEVQALLKEFAALDRQPENPPGIAPDSKSVAVLAFANLSDDKSNEYFSDGISEELLTVLQKIPGLHVAARTSAFSFKGKNATAQEIGRQLSVAHLVEGSVQKSGTRVKITARLSRVATGEELWSKSYTREVKDVFALQEELALAIVGELRGQLPGGDNAAAIKAAVKGGTTNPEAYQQHLQGRYFFNRHAEKSVSEGLAFFQRAVELDPTFALAWAGLSRAHGWLCNFSTELGREGFNAHLAAARTAADHALALEPNLPEALLARAELQLNFDYDWNGAGESLRSALALAPADPALVIVSGNLASARGDIAGSIALLRRAVALDPVNPVARSYLAFSLASFGYLAEAEAEYPRVVELNPAAPWAHAGLGVAYLLAGKYEQAAAAAQDDSAEWARLLVTAMARWGQKRMPEADAALARLTEGFADTAAYQLAEAHAFRGETDQAFEWLERAYRQRDGGVISTKTDPFFVNLHADPRWEAFLRKLGLADDQLK